MKNKVFMVLLALTVFLASCENPAASPEYYGSAGKFVAIASGSGHTAWSEDGKTWTSGGRLPAEPAEDGGVQGVSWKSIAYGRGKLAAVSYGTEAKSAWSADGLSWTESALPGTMKSFQDIVYGNGKFVAVTLTAGAGDRAAYSADGGLTWTASSSLSPGSWYSVAYGNGTFVAVDGSTDKKTAWSADGATWTEGQTLPIGAAGYWKTVVYGNGKFIAFSNTADITYSTDNGASWSARVTGGESGLLSDISEAAYGGRRFVAVFGDSSASNKAAWSEDGLAWAVVDLPVSTYWTGVAYGKEVFVAVARGTAAWSKDGKVWAAAEGLPDLQGGASWDALTFVEAY
ncbi:MAG: hypothetical protein LBD86_00235 [Spirochaetaceae bacterium]|jgi:hypothetical protein|nr:hypothetical protein [Spirochaetaceae bacterium]